MIRRYALDPGVVEDGMAFVAFVAGLGVEHGRLLVRYPKDWIRRAKEQVETMPPSRHRLRTEELLKRLAIDGRLKVRLGVDYEPTLSWLENAVAHEDAFDAVIYTDGSPVPGRPTRAHQASELVPPGAFWATARRREFVSEATTLAILLGPLLTLERSAAVMDPYFNPSRRDFEGAIRLLLTCAPNLVNLVIHTSAAPTAGTLRLPSDQWQAECERVLGPMVTVGRSLTIVRWATGRTGAKPHERWIVSPIGGVALDRGIALDRQPNSASLLDQGSAARLWEEFGDGTKTSGKPFDHFDSVHLGGV